jgi:hypothetical protein
MICYLVETLCWSHLIGVSTRMDNSAGMEYLHATCMCSHACVCTRKGVCIRAVSCKFYVYVFVVSEI